MNISVKIAETLKSISFPFQEMGLRNAKRVAEAWIAL
jgi:hypothetical protein